MIFDDLLKKNQLVAFAKKAQQPAPILAKIAQEHGFDKTAKLFQSGRIEDMVENLGSDLVDRFSQKINQQTQKEFRPHPLR